MTRQSPHQSRRRPSARCAFDKYSYRRRIASLPPPLAAALATPKTMVRKGGSWCPAARAAVISASKSAPHAPPSPRRHRGRVPPPALAPAAH
jgi:hypothetical protein